MGRLRVSDLAPAEAPHRVDLLNPKFESEAFARSWDHRKAELLRNDARQHGGEWGIRGNELADLIDPRLNPGIPNSLASSRRWRKLRILLGGGLLKLHHEHSQGQLIRADIIKPSWRRDVWDFQTDSPGRLFNEFRSTLNRARNGRDLSGFMLGGYHNEWDEDAHMYQPHIHIVAAEQHIGLLHDLKGRRGFESGRGGKGPVADPILVRESHVTSPEYALLYLFKSYWLRTFRLANGDRCHRQLMAPYHSEFLLWLDQRSINDLVFLYGLNVSKGGILLPSK